MKKLIVYGITEMAEYLYPYLIRDNEVEVVAFTVESKYLKSLAYLIIGEFKFK